jgi:gliding motility-associated lipoprotein GldH
MNFPNGKVISDTLEYEMAYPNGDWMGVGFGEIKESKLWYKSGVKFPEEGVYQFKIRQGMRKSGNVDGVQTLEGITDVGFRIEKS